MKLAASSRVPLWLALWALLVGLMYFIRPAFPVDETRYLAVAWEMWWRHSIAVPYLNHEYYDGKPPLFFWLMHLGWLMTGVNEWWARFIAPLAGLACLGLTRAVARRLWPHTNAHVLGPLILLGSFYWTLFCASTMFDTLLGAFALSSIYFIVRAAQEGRTSHFIAAGISLGLGILAKGPVVFLPALFVVGSGPWWMDKAWKPLWPRRRWYGAGCAAILFAAAIAALWLAPMALSSDSAYLYNMVFHQTGGYVSESFSHRRPFWWYVPVVPLLLLPWTIWPAAWRRIAALRHRPPESGVRLCAVWAGGVLIAFSLMSGKQPHYPLLMFPAVALLLARVLPQAEARVDRSILIPAIAFALVGIAMLAVTAGWFKQSGAAWSRVAPGKIAYLAPTAMLAIATMVARTRHLSVEARVAGLSAATCFTVLIVMWLTMRISAGAYDVRPASAFLSQLVSQGEPIAVASTYDGQFNFYGRIKARMEPIEPKEVVEWARQHTSGYVVAFYKASNWPPANRGKPPRFQSLYRGGGLVVWAAGDLIAEPELAQAFR